jgi:TPR repeat protein
MYLRSMGGPRDPKRGVELLEAAAKNGHAEAQFVLGTELFKGDLMAPDRKRGLALLLSSARQKYAYAQYGLCVELSADESQFYDAVQAYAWCRASAKKNHKLAERAAQRGNETLGKILVKQGTEAVEAAKVRAASYERQY